MAAVFCKECGEELTNGAKFCAKCGTKVINATSAGISQTNISTKSVKTPKKKTSTGVKILAVVLFLIFMGVIFGNTKTPNVDTHSTGDQVNTTSAASSTKNKGEPARDGKFEFVVKSVECGKSSVGTNQYLTKSAQGQYCLLNITVKNIGNEAQSLFSSNQYLYNAKGQKFSADDIATSYAAPDASSAWYNEINPGNTVEGVVVFDLAKDTSPATAELHDSTYSGGVKVTL